MGDPEKVSHHYIAKKNGISKMKTLFVTSAIALMCFTSSASALNQQDKDFAIISTGAWAALYACPNIEVVDGAAERFADKNGANFDVIGPALVAAWKAQTDQPYERSDLIAEVTVIVAKVLRDIDKQFASNKPKACVQWTDFAIHFGLARQTGKQ